MADKKSKPAELRSLSTEEMRARLNDVRHELMNLRFQQATGELTDFTRLRQTKRLVARLMTMVDERERAGKEG